ncbi:PTS sugar transporter subunit IIA [Marisediminicola sp. LYQ134]|uniref:PTS sugar transporter subunit IIA n=1 Tax=Marisediminicola sp. LYQ134 TaxID=3391061 RepID=UPI0039830CA4
MPQHTDPASPLVDLLGADSVVLHSSARDVESAIREVGGLLVKAGAVEESYLDAMLAREESVSTFVGDGIAFPHATLASRGDVSHDALALVTFAEPLDWNGESVTIAIGIAARGRGHVGLVSRLASVLLVPGRADELRAAPDVAAAAHALRESD